MAVEGVIAERVRGILPVTWDAMSKDARYGDALLRSTIDTAKERILGENVTPPDEANYPLLVVDYVAKIAILELITPAIDYWMNMPISTSATGTNENQTYTERVTALQQLRENLLAETRRLAGDVATLINFRRVSGKAVPKLNTIGDDLLTPSPQDFPRPYSASTS
jgi:hypothetical protein